MNVSVIIPAHNAANTIAETLESLQAQTFSGWEAIIVDDGSSDGTISIVLGFAEKDSRIRVVSQPKSGVSSARNTGIKSARYDWLLFLDADDLLLPQHLERMTNKLISDRRLDAVHCGWGRITPDGSRFKEKYCSEQGNLFPVFAHTCSFAIHACIIRRSIVEHLGGFDTSFVTCEDWDLWQRIARSGACFGGIDEVLSLYRMRPDSASNKGFRLFADALRVIENGHSFDIRVPNPVPEYRNGMPVSELPARKLYLACWSAGLVLGTGNDAQPLLEKLKDVHDPGLYPDVVAEDIFESALLFRCQLPSAWNIIFPDIEQNIEDFLIALEKQSQASGLARRASTALKRLILERSTTSRPLTIGTIHAVRIELTEPIRDVIPPDPVERLNCNIEFEGTHIGIIELPVCDGVVLGHVIADAIAADFAWPILSHFFERTVYPNLRVKREPEGFSIWRGTLRLTEPIPTDENTVRQQIHERVGWTVFLQEIWGCQYHPLESFYTPGLKLSLKKGGWRLFLRNLWEWYIRPHVHIFTTTAGRRAINDGWIVVEVSNKLPDIETSGKEFDVVLTVGGVAIGKVTIPAKKNTILVGELRAVLTMASRFELCRAAVREGLLGRSMTDKPALIRDRLAAVKAANLKRLWDDSSLKSCTEVAFSPEASDALDRTLSPGNHCMILGRHTHGRIGTSVSRRATLPTAAAPELIDAALANGEPVIWVPETGERPRHVIYSPDLIWRPIIDEQTTLLGSQISNTIQIKNSRTSYKKYNDTNAMTDQLPILMYHRIAPAGKPSTARYRVTPDAFEEQLRHLRDNGYYSASLEDWRSAMERKRPLPGRAVIITFDDGYLDFLTHAWPLLKRYGFSAIVFLVTDNVGRSNSWDCIYGEELPLLGWEDIRQLQSEGVEFGSHTASHPYLTALSPEKIVREGARSRAILRRELGQAVRAFAYPYGDVDRVVQHLIGACGYIFSLSCRRGPSSFQDTLLELPRIEIMGSDSLQEFINKVNIHPVRVPEYK